MNRPDISLALAERPPSPVEQLAARVARLEGDVRFLHWWIMGLHVAGVVVVVAGR